MKPISPTLHGILDYGTVLFLALAPTLFRLTETPALALYILAVIIAGLTLITAFPPGLVRLIRVRTHGGVDLVTSFVIAALPWILGFADQPVARNLFLAVALLLLLVWLLTDWRETSGHTLLDAR